MRINWLTNAQALQYTRLNKTAFYALLKKHAIPRQAVPNSRKVRYSRAALDAALNPEHVEVTRKSEPANGTNGHAKPTNGNGHAAPPEWSDKALWALAFNAVRAGLLTEQEALQRLAARAGVTWGP